MIEVRNLSKTYGAATNAPALDDVSFKVSRGEIVGFLGPNGAGKTTTMRLLAGLMAPSGGQASIAGHPIGSREARACLGYAPENAPAYPDMSVRDFLVHLAALRGVPKNKRPERLEAALDAGKLEERADMLIGKLSKGMRARLGLAQAIVHDPPVVILDEPSAGLDPRQRVETRRFIRSLAREHTILLSTHILPDVQEVCERVLIIHRGRLVAREELASPESGAWTLKLSVRRAPHDLVTHLQTIEGVREVERESQSEGASTWSVRCEADAREEIARACADGNWGLLEISREERSLEALFLSATADEV
jgi:ABC-2 type transport system ATP-binding protein